MTRKTLKKMLAGFHSEDEEEENLTFKLIFLALASEEDVRLIFKKRRF